MGNRHGGDKPKVEKQKRKKDKKAKHKGKKKAPGLDIDADLESSHYSRADSESMVFHSAENLSPYLDASTRSEEGATYSGAYDNGKILSSKDFHDGFSIEACLPADLAAYGRASDVHRNAGVGDVTTLRGATDDGESLASVGYSTPLLSSPQVRRGLPRSPLAQRAKDSFLEPVPPIPSDFSSSRSSSACQDDLSSTGDVGSSRTSSSTVDTNAATCIERLEQLERTIERTFIEKFSDLDSVSPARKDDSGGSTPTIKRRGVEAGSKSREGSLTPKGTHPAWGGSQSIDNSPSVCRKGGDVGSTLGREGHGTLKPVVSGPLSHSAENSPVNLRKFQKHYDRPDIARTPMTHFSPSSLKKSTLGPESPGADHRNKTHTESPTLLQKAQGSPLVTPRGATRVTTTSPSVSQTGVEHKELQNIKKRSPTRIKDASRTPGQDGYISSSSSQSKSPEIRRKPAVATTTTSPCSSSLGRKQFAVERNRPFPTGPCRPVAKSSSSSPRSLERKRIVIEYKRPDLDPSSSPKPIRYYEVNRGTPVKHCTVATQPSTAVVLVSNTLSQENISDINTKNEHAKTQENSAMPVAGTSPAQHSEKEHKQAQQKIGQISEVSEEGIRQSSESAVFGSVSPKLKRQKKISSTEPTHQTVVPIEDSLQHKTHDAKLVHSGTTHSPTTTTTRAPHLQSDNREVDPSTCPTVSKHSVSVIEYKGNPSTACISILKQPISPQLVSRTAAMGKKQTPGGHTFSAQDWGTEKTYHSELTVGNLSENKSSLSNAAKITVTKSDQPTTESCLATTAHHSQGNISKSNLYTHVIIPSAVSSLPSAGSEVDEHKTNVVSTQRVKIKEERMPKYTVSGGKAERVKGSSDTGLSKSASVAESTAHEIRSKEFHSRIKEWCSLESHPRVEAGVQTGMPSVQNIQEEQISLCTGLSDQRSQRACENRDMRTSACGNREPSPLLLSDSSSNSSSRKLGKNLGERIRDVIKESTYHEVFTAELSPSSEQEPEGHLLRRQTRKNDSSRRHFSECSDDSEGSCEEEWEQVSDSEQVRDTFHESISPVNAEKEDPVEEGGTAHLKSDICYPLLCETDHPNYQAQDWLHSHGHHQDWSRRPQNLTLDFQSVTVHRLNTFSLPDAKSSHHREDSSYAHVAASHYYQNQAHCQTQQLRKTECVNVTGSRDEQSATHCHRLCTDATPTSEEVKEFVACATQNYENELADRESAKCRDGQTAAKRTNARTTLTERENTRGRSVMERKIQKEKECGSPREKECTNAAAIQVSSPLRAKGDNPSVTNAVSHPSADHSSQHFTESPALEQARAAENNDVRKRQLAKDKKTQELSNVSEATNVLPECSNSQRAIVQNVAIDNTIGISCGDGTLMDKTSTDKETCTAQTTTVAKMEEQELKEKENKTKTGSRTGIESEEKMSSLESASVSRLALCDAGNGQCDVTLLEHVPPPSPLAMDVLAEDEENEDDKVCAEHDDTDLSVKISNEMRLFGETVVKRLSNLLEDQASDDNCLEGEKKHASPAHIHRSPSVSSSDKELYLEFKSPSGLELELLQPTSGDLHQLAAVCTHDNGFVKDGDAGEVINADRMGSIYHDSLSCDATHEDEPPALYDDKPHDAFNLSVSRPLSAETADTFTDPETTSSSKRTSTASTATDDTLTSSKTRSTTDSEDVAFLLPKSLVFVRSVDEEARGEGIVLETGLIVKRPSVPPELARPSNLLEVKGERPRKKRRRHPGNTFEHGLKPDLNEPEAKRGLQQGRGKIVDVYGNENSDDCDLSSSNDSPSNRNQTETFRNGKMSSAHVSAQYNPDVRLWDLAGKPDDELCIDSAEDDDESANHNHRHSSSSVDSSLRIPEIEETFSELMTVKSFLEDLQDRTPTAESLPIFVGQDEFRAKDAWSSSRRSRLSPAKTDRTESDLDASEQRDDASTDSMYADDEDEGAGTVFHRSYSEEHGGDVLVSCTIYNSSHDADADSDDFWAESSTTEESYKQLETAADAAGSAFQNARIQMHDIHQHLQDLRRQMEQLQENITSRSLTLTPEYSYESCEHRPITE